MELNSSIKMLAHAISTHDVLAENSFVFGGCAIGKENTSDLDIFIDVRPHRTIPKEIWGPLRTLLAMTRYGTEHYGSFDPFIQTGSGLMCRTPEGDGLQYAKRIRVEHRIPFKEWYTSAIKELI